MLKQINVYLKIEASKSFWDIIDNIINELNTILSCQALYINNSHVSLIGNVASINEKDLKYAFTLLVTNNINGKNREIITNIENAYNICLNIIYYEEDDVVLLHSFKEE